MRPQPPEPQSRGTDSKLWIIDVASGETRLLTDKNRGAQPVWSPHGNRIAFWGVTADAQRDLFTIDGQSPNAEPKAVFADVPLEWNPLWSPDGRYLYFGSDRGGTMNLWRIGIDETTGERRGDPVALPVPSRFAGLFSITRDGRHLLYSALETGGAIERAPLTDPRRSTTVLSGSLLIFSFELSPDAQWIAFSNSGVQEDLFIARTATGEIRQITNDRYRDRGPSWTPDGRQILFYSNRSGKYEIWKINVDGSGLTKMSDNIAPSAWFPRMSPDGTKVSVNGFDMSMWFPVGSGPARKGEQVPLPSDPSLRFIASTWSPDSRKMGGIFTRREGLFPLGVGIYDLESRSFETVSDRGYAIRWLPAGNAIVMLDEDQLFIIDLATKRKRAYPFFKVMTSLVAGRANPFWTDGKEVYWVNQFNEADIWQVTLD